MTLGSLPAEDRAVAIAKRLSETGRVTISALAAEFGVSEMTIRRDLDELEALGAARRVRGGAVPVGPVPFSERHRRQARAKARIADKLLSLVPDTGTIALDASSTVNRLATALAGARDLTVVTNGPDTFNVLQGKPGITAVLTGGALEPRTGSLVGPVACRVAEDFLFDLFICSAAALDLELGSSEASLEEAEVKRSIGASATKIVLAADRSKLGTRAQARVFTLDQVSLLVTDLDRNDTRLAPYAREVATR